MISYVHLMLYLAQLLKSYEIYLKMLLMYQNGILKHIQGTQTKAGKENREMEKQKEQTENKK